MKRGVSVVLISLAIVFSCAMVSGYEIEWWYVQHRNNENGTQPNVAHFAITDSAGNYVKDDVIQSIKLYDPDGEEVTLAEAGFYGAYNTLYGSYDADSGHWSYDNTFEAESYYRVEFYEPLKLGRYHYVLKDKQGNTLESYKTCSGSAEDLPIISSQSFYARKDSDGNLIWTWDVPYDIPSHLSTSARAWITAIDGDEENEIYVKNIPPHMGTLFVPSDTFQKLNPENSKLRFGVQLTTSGNSNRSYSDTLILDNGADVPMIPEASDGGYRVTSDLWIKAVINTEEKGAVNAVFYKGEEKKTERGDTVIWGYFYASPSDVTWGDKGNPDLYVKLWFDVSGRKDVNFFHVSVPDIEVYSACPYNGSYDQHGTATMDDRHIRHEY